MRTAAEKAADSGGTQSNRKPCFRISKPDLVIQMGTSLPEEIEFLLDRNVPARRGGDTYVTLGSASRPLGGPLGGPPTLVPVVHSVLRFSIRHPKMVTIRRYPQQGRPFPSEAGSAMPSQEAYDESA